MRIKKLSILELVQYFRNIFHKDFAIILMLVASSRSDILEDSLGSNMINTELHIEFDLGVP